MEILILQFLERRMFAIFLRLVAFLCVASLGGILPCQFRSEDLSLVCILKQLKSLTTSTKVHHHEATSKKVEVGKVNAFNVLQNYLTCHLSQSHGTSTVRSL